TPLVELLRISRGDEPAVAGEQREFGGERSPEALDKDAVLTKLLPRLGEALGQRDQTRLGEHVAQPRGFSQRLAPCRKIARAAAPEAEACQGPFDIGAAL